MTDEKNFKTGVELMSESVNSNNGNVALTRVHNIDAVSEQSFWFGHVAFSILALLAVAFIIIARGPRRRDALMSGNGGEGKD